MSAPPSISDGTAPTFLGIPCKVAQPVELEVELKKLLESDLYGPTTHPADSDDDIAALAAMRKSVEGKLEANEASLNALLRYYAHLSSAMTKLPSEIPKAFVYSVLFATPDTAGPPLPGSVAVFESSGSSSFGFEQACVLFNIAALHSQLGSAGRRNDGEGVKQIIFHHQHAAGCFARVRAMLPQAQISTTPDLSPAALKAFETLSLAQAQEGAWQKSLQGQSTNGVMSRLACEASRLYSSSLEHFMDAKAEPDPVRRLALPAIWATHLRLKAAHFAAVAQYRRSLDDGAANRYGAEISRLEEASRLLKATVGPRSVDVDAGRHAQSLLGHVDQILKTARRDNDFIYLQEVPPVSVLPRLQPASLVKPTLPLPVSSPLDVLNDRLGGLGPPLFGSLVPFDVHNAIRLYDDRKEEYVLREIGDQCRKLDLEELNALQAMNLPGSLEALERPAELPPSLIRNSEATRSEGGPAAIVAMLGDVAKLSVGNRRLLDETSQSLGEEASRDDGLRAQYGALRWTRPASDSAGATLREREGSLLRTLEMATHSDADVRAKWDEWAGRIRQLAQEPSTLRESIPCSAAQLSLNSSHAVTGRDQLDGTRRLRRLLDDLRTVHEARQNIFTECQAVSSKDNIRPIVMRRLEQMQAGSSPPPDIRLSDFEALFDVELRKYQTYEEMMATNAAEQATLLAQVKDANNRFLELRGATANIGPREEALQALDLAYQRFKELTSNLHEGLKFHDAFGKLASQLLDESKRFVYSRAVEARDISQSLDAAEATASSALDASELSTPPSPQNRRGVASPGVYDPDVHGPIRWG